MREMKFLLLLNIERNKIKKTWEEKMEDRSTINEENKKKYIKNVSGNDSKKRF